MKITSIILLFFLLGLNNSPAQTTKTDWIFQPEDQSLAEEILQDFSSKSSLPIADLVTEIGLSFAGTPYGAATLENGLEEKMVINLRELDCTTFVENCLALARTIKSEKKDFGSFVAELEKIRYRDGIRNQYLSRLHYFSEWIHNSQTKGIISETVNQNGVNESRTINFMSVHPGSYPVLTTHPELIPLLAEQEKSLSMLDFQYFPKDQLDNLYKYLRHGDLIGLTSSVKGLDINHTGIIVRKDTDFYLLHASQSEGKVMLANEPLGNFLKPASKNMGVMIARPVF